MAQRKLNVPSLAGSPVAVYWNAELQEYIVKIKGLKPTAWYYTQDKMDALSTAQHMRNNLPDELVEKLFA